MSPRARREVLAVDPDGAVEGGFHPGREPRLNAEIEGDHGEDGNQDRGDDRDRAEQHDKANMQPRASDAGAAVDPQSRQPPGNQRAERQHQRKIDEQKNDQRR